MASALPHHAPAAPLLALESISLSFKGIRAVQDIGFEVARGEICALIGSNGAGKSSLLNVVSGVYRPQQGAIVFDGQRLAHVDPVWAAQELAEDLPVQGNLDPLALIAGGKTMTGAAARILDAFASRPHIFNLGHGILPDTPIAHVEQLLGFVKGGK